MRYKMNKERLEQLSGLAIDFLCHCEIDKKGRLYDPTGKAKHFLEYMKDLYFVSEENEK